MVFSLFWGFFVLIILYNEFKEVKIIVGYICFVVELMVFVVIVYVCFGIYKDRDNWIKEKWWLIVILIKIIIFWILGIF